MDMKLEVVSFSDPDGNGWFVQEIMPTRNFRAGEIMPATYDSAAELAEAARGASR